MIAALLGSIPSPSSNGISIGPLDLRMYGLMIALGVIANCVPGTYSAAIGCQIMGRWGQMLPRWIWVVFLVAIQLACALAGRNALFVIFSNFLALMGYWVMVMICIVL